MTQPKLSPETEAALEDFLTKNLTIKLEVSQKGLSHWIKAGVYLKGKEISWDFVSSSSIFWKEDNNNYPELKDKNVSA